MIFFKAKKPAVSAELIQKYKDLCERTALILAHFGKAVRPYDDETFPRLNLHPDPERVVENLSLWYQVLSDASIAGDSLLDDRRLVWRMLQKLKLTPSADMMNFLEDGDIIEIYTTDNWQIFRNLRFFDCLHITIDEVSTMIWSRDSKRKTSISLEALRLVLLIKTKQLRNTFRLTSLPKHEMTCTFSGVVQVVEINLKIAAPLFGKNGLSGYLITESAKRLN